MVVVSNQSISRSFTWGGKRVADYIKEVLGGRDLVDIDTGNKLNLDRLLKK